MVSMAETARAQEAALQNLSQRFNESLSDPTTATVTSLKSMVARLEAQTVAIEKEKKDVEDMLEKQKKSIPRKNYAEENTMLDSRARNKKLVEDLDKAKEELILTRNELASTKKDLAFHVSALQTMLVKAKEREADGR